MSPAVRRNTPQRADRLTAGVPTPDVHAAVHVEVVDGAAAVSAEDAAGVGVVDHHDAVEFLGEGAERRQRAQVAVHAEDAVGDEELALRRGERAQDLTRRVDVLVREDFDRRPAEAASVDDARVIQLVGDDDVVLAEDRRDRARVRRKAALEDDDRFGLLEVGEPALELHVDAHRSGDRAHRSGSDTEVLDGFERAGTQTGMRRQSEVVVRGQVDDLSAVEHRPRFLLAFQNPKNAITSPCCFQRFDLSGQVAGEDLASHVGCRPATGLALNVKARTEQLWDQRRGVGSCIVAIFLVAHEP